MSFLQWINLSIFMDIFLLVFSSAVIWKMRRLESKIKTIDDKVHLIAKNPKDAKRLLKKMP